VRKYIQLCHESEYAQDCDALYAENKRYREAVALLEWLIVIDPYGFPLVSEAESGIADMRVALGDPIGGLDPISIMYTIDDDKSGTLWGAKKIDLTDFLNGLS